MVCNYSYSTLIVIICYSDSNGLLSYAQGIGPSLHLLHFFAAFDRQNACVAGQLHTAGTVYADRSDLPIQKPPQL